MLEDTLPLISEHQIFGFYLYSDKISFKLFPDISNINIYIKQLINYVIYSIICGIMNFFFGRLQILLSIYFAKGIISTEHGNT